MKTSPTTFLFAPLFFACLSSAASAIDCQQPIRVKGKSFDFSHLDSPHSVYSIDKTRPPAIYNTTWTVNICHPLKVEKSKEKDQCPHGTNICGVVRSYNPDDDPDHEHDQLENVIPIAGSFEHDTGKSSEPTWTRLSSQDSQANGLQLEIKGGKFGGRNQKAVIKFQCDPKRSGNNDKGEEDKRKRDDDDEKDDDNSDDDGADLTFKSYGPIEEKGVMVDILRLDWKTKYACEDYESDDPSGSQGWGFFTWFILILFLGIAAYLVFGSWLNYNRYGARGWDLLPHGDTIRDIPYLVKDWGRKVVDTVSGPGSRGGYSAV